MAQACARALLLVCWLKNREVLLFNKVVGFLIRIIVQKIFKRTTIILTDLVILVENIVFDNRIFGDGTTGSFFFNRVGLRGFAEGRGFFLLLCLLVLLCGVVLVLLCKITAFSQKRFLKRRVLAFKEKEYFYAFLDSGIIVVFHSVVYISA